MTLKSGSNVTQGHRNRHGSIRHLWLPINVLVTLGLSRTVSEINGDIRQKSPIFLTPMYFAPPLTGFPLELGIGARDLKTRVMGLPGRTRSLSISLAVWIQSTNVTEVQTDTGRCPDKMPLDKMPPDEMPRTKCHRKKMPSKQLNVFFYIFF